MRLRALGLAAGVAGLVIGAATMAGAASAAPAAAAHWHLIDALPSGATGDFTAVVASGKSAGWAFNGAGAPAGPAAWKLTGGSTWTRVAFPGRPSEEVIAAAATSAADVWAADDSIFGTSARLLRWNGHAWSAVKSFAAGISGVSVLTAHDVWVFGYPAAPGQPALGVWHYNGGTWSHVSRTLQGGSALAWNNVWAYSGTAVDHWNGTRWASTSVRGLLPPTLRTHLNFPAVTGILALSSANVYAIGNGNLQDEGGPTVVLHYNGHKWARVASGQFGPGAGQQLSTDGRGGLWLPMPGGAGAASFIVHYAAGKLTKSALPIAAARIDIDSVARIPGTSRELAGGFSHAAGNRGSKIVAVVLEYS